MISVVCVYNNAGILQDYLLKSLKGQTVEFELIKLNNTEGAFKSAAEALNYGGKKAKGKYIIFVHQDVDLSSNSWLENVEKILDGISNLGIAGVAGESENKMGVMSNIRHGNPPELAGKTQIRIPQKMQTLDECLFIIPTSVFDILQFDEEVCDDWHLYAGDYCLTVKNRGFDVYVIPIYVYHRSPGYSMSKSYYVTLRKMIKKHRKHYKRIYTLRGTWSTFYPFLEMQKTFRILRRRTGIILEKLGIKIQVKTLLERVGVLKK